MDTQQMPLFADAEVQAEGPARPWHLKWGVVAEGGTDQGQEQATDSREDAA
jgi:hypothetical protein